MCINENVSLITFLTCSLICCYLYYRNKLDDRWIALFFGYLGLIQFLEYLMWKDQKCTGLNQLATNISFFHITLQPILSIFMAFYYRRNLFSKLFYIPFILYILFSVPFIIKAKKPNQCSLPCTKEQIGLSWEYTSTEYNIIVWTLFLMALSSPLLLIKKYGNKLFLSTTITYIIAHIISSNRCSSQNVTPANGSWWCLMAVVGPIIVLIT